MARSPPKAFLDLPGEIRNTIWKHTFGDLTFHTYSPDHIEKDARRFSNTRWSTSLSSVNRQVRQEATSAFSDNLTLYCDYTDLYRLDSYPAFIMRNLSKVVATINVPDDEEGLGKIPIDDLRHKWMPKLQVLTLVPEQPLICSLNSTNLQDDLLILLRGGFDEPILKQTSCPLVSASAYPCAEEVVEEDNLRVLRKVELLRSWQRVCLRWLYRLEVAPRTQRILTRMINVSQSRSYLFGEWVPVEEVVLMIDEVSYPVVYSVRKRMGRVLVKSDAKIEVVERELGDQERLERALAKAFDCK